MSVAHYLVYSVCPPSCWRQGERCLSRPHPRLRSGLAPLYSPTSLGSLNDPRTPVTRHLKFPDKYLGKRCVTHSPKPPFRIVHLSTATYCLQLYNPTIDAFNQRFIVIVHQKIPHSIYCRKSQLISSPPLALLRKGCTRSNCF